MKQKKTGGLLKWIAVALVAAILLALPASASWETETSTQDDDYISVEDSETLRQ